ncbi:uncharacterized protein I303_107780 [Kwoniella dejecticola CBS 10117]|uniref:TIGR02453 family protein n=1 Tax=Kwoniella dejecticola CBS 10117 TaxID=1296121 RepID=A0A1A5ZVP7_9TREE|nr:uncharacterized protein I303_07785 [Kwoniella dejecticola CBS 10117]OBR81875.1 hypothetical protein I303_07785 [Kwoniella dejecticola CBS 10117]
MAKAKSMSTPTGARSSPRISAAASAKSTPSRSAKKPNTSTPLRNSARSAATPTKKGGKWIEKSAKTSPYFSKTKGKAKPKGKAKTTAKPSTRIQQNDEDDEDSPTGLTESEPSSTEDEGSEDDFVASSEDEAEVDEPIDDDSEDEDGSIDSDFLDEPKSKTKKRKSISSSGNTKSAKKAKLHKSPHTHTHTHKQNRDKSHTRIEGYEDEDEDDEDEEIELEEGQEIAGRIYPAPKTGQVPPGRISQNTLNFLKNLQIPERNDREWFRSHEPAFRQAENEWKAFVGTVQLKFHEADDEVPILPPKDIIHRIYRDVRFSSDKTPYKRNFSMSTSRGGRKGIWAAYHLSISPNNKSLLACGVWQPGKDELALIRHRLLASPQQFRDCISAPDFVRLFGEAKDKKGKRQNVFGNDDALKVAPKGVEKDHKDIDLLKLRSIAVVHHFTDEQVIAKDFQEQLYDVLVVMRPFVRLLNDYVSLPQDNANADDDAGDVGDEEEDDQEE